MELPPEEKRRIYEEEKARIEAREQIERERGRMPGTTSTGLRPNVAGLLCYIAGWITGIIFFILEQKNSWVRFHAAQSIIVFGSITVAGMVIGWIPFLGPPLATITSIIGFILWIILMLKAYQGERHRVIWAGDIAERMVSSSGMTYEYHEPAAPPEPPAPPKPATPPEPTETAPPAGRDLESRTERKAGEYFKNRREGRITASAFAVAWSIVLLVFFNFYYQYVAYYHSETIGNIVRWTRYPFFTEAIHLWLPVLTTTLVISILGHIVLIILDRYILRQLIHMVIDAFAFATVITLLTVFPFNFSMIPNATIASSMPFGVSIILICVAVGIGIGILVRAIKLIVNIARGAASYGEGV